MPARMITCPGPAGGLRAGRRALRRWIWHRSGGGLLSAPVRCRSETWYLVRVRGEAAAALVLFEREGRAIGRRALRLAAAPIGERLAWLETPAGCKALRLELAADATDVTDVELRKIADRDPVSHPLASVPRWSAGLPPLRPSRVVLPASLASLAGMVDWIDVQVARPPASCAALAELVRGAVAVIDPAWCAALGLRWRELEALAAEAWVLVDLESAARLRRAECKTWCDSADIMSARVAYADVPTRGFALQDVLPYAFVDERGRFGTRVIRATRAWRAAAARAAIVTVLSSETPWAARCGDVLAAQRLTPRGRLLLTDLPWLVSGALGRLLAPRLAAALLRAHLCGPVADHQQHWNRSDDTQIVVRDLADLSRRYPPLHAIRWQTGGDGVLHLGIALPAGPPPGSAVLTISTGRIDALDVHDGLPPEPLAIFMKWLAREWRAQTDWARRHLNGRTVVWQFDAAVGHKYAVEFDSAARLPSGPNTVVNLRVAGASHERAAPGALLTMPADEGLLGDGSFEFQDELTRRLCRLIERSA